MIDSTQPAARAPNRTTHHTGSSGMKHSPTSRAAHPSCKIPNSTTPWTASRRLPKGDHSVSFTFKEEEMAVGNDQASVKHAYSDLLVAGETGTYFFLFLSSQLGYIVDKRSMAAGEADILRERLEAALGEPVQAL